MTLTLMLMVINAVQFCVNMCRPAEPLGKFLLLKLETADSYFTAVTTNVQQITDSTFKGLMEMKESVFSQSLNFTHCTVH